MTSRRASAGSSSPAPGANLVLNLAMFIAFVRIEIGLALLLFYLFPAIVAVASVAVVRRAARRACAGRRSASRCSGSR